MCGFLFLFLSSFLCMIFFHFLCWNLVLSLPPSPSLSLSLWFFVFVSLNRNQINAYNGSDSAGQNERFGDKIAQETIGNRQNQEESDGYYLNTSDGSNITLTNAGMSYVYGPMYGSPQLLAHIDCLWVIWIYAYMMLAYTDLYRSTITSCWSLALHTHICIDQLSCLLLLQCLFFTWSKSCALAMCRNARCSTWIKTLGTHSINFIILRTSLCMVECPFYFPFGSKNNLLIIYPLLNCCWHSKNQSGIIKKKA